MYTSAKPYFYGTGRRKKSVARVRLYPGTGVVTINGRNIDEYFGLETTDVTGVMIVDLLIQLLTGKDCLGGIDNDNEFTAINMGGELRAMLTTENVSSFYCNTTEGFVSRIDNEPSAFHSVRISHVSGHCTSS